MNHFKRFVGISRNVLIISKDNNIRSHSIVSMGVLDSQLLVKFARFLGYQSKFHPLSQLYVLPKRTRQPPNELWAGSSLLLFDRSCRCFVRIEEKGVYVTVWKVKPKFIMFFVCNPCFFMVSYYYGLIINLWFNMA